MESVPRQSNESNPEREINRDYLSEDGFMREVQRDKGLLDGLAGTMKDAKLNGKIEDSEFGKVQLELEEIRKKIMEIESRYR